MDKEQELTKKIRYAIIIALSKENITLAEGMNAILSAVTQILYACAASYPENRKKTEKEFALAVYLDVIEQLKGMPDNIFSEEEPL
jgi:penicillin V acylase-like amidase (Ntn superfamily)